MTITYETTLEVDGQGAIDIGQQLDFIRVASGSSDGWEQPTPGTCQISFLGSPTMGTDQRTAAWWLGRMVGIKVTPSDGSITPVFYGRVNSVNATPDDSQAEVMRITLDLQTQMAELAPYLVTQTRPAEVQNVRILALFRDARDISWSEVGGNLFWSDVDPTVTWAQYHDPSFPGYGLSDISSMPMVSYTPTDAPIDDVMFQYAIGQNGFFGENLIFNPSPNLYYELFYTLPDQWVVPATKTIDLATCAIGNDLTANLNLSDVYNYVEATNGTDMSIFEDPASIDSYGRRPLNVETQMALINDIDTMVAQRAAGRSTPVQALSAVTFDYDVMASNRIFFIGETQNFNFTNVPAAFGGNQAYTLRGMESLITYRHAEATWRVVPQSQLAYFTSWYLTPSTATWATFETALTKWSDLT